MSERRRIEDLIRRSIHGPAWHGPAVLEVLADVTPLQASAHPVAQAHSIWELALHIRLWMDIPRCRVTGEPVDEPELGLDWPEPGDPTPERWSGAIRSIEQSCDALVVSIGRLDDAGLRKKITDKTYSVAFMLHGVVAHNLYHGGQIALLKKAVARS